MIAALLMFQSSPLPPNMPPVELVVPVVGIVFGTLTTMVLGLPIIRAIIRWVERRHAPAPQLPADLSGRIERMEQTLDAIAIEVERISEAQRYLTKLQTEQRAIGGPGAAPGAR
ncbi:MAG TPA: hypothetical protein VG818_13040 [Gemmatimonadaceae bacterium]|jgi:hypothetical protein|nr:hypothetical protein [Gemmatimonadaceae bacterium]